MEVYNDSIENIINKVKKLKPKNTNYYINDTLERYIYYHNMDIKYLDALKEYHTDNDFKEKCDKLIEGNNEILRLRIIMACFIEKKLKI